MRCQVTSAFMLGQLISEISKEMFPAVRADERQRVHDRILGELVCCDITEKISKTYETRLYDNTRPEKLALLLGLDWHDMCYYGAWAAEIANPPVQELQEGPGAATPGV